MSEVEPHSNLVQNETNPNDQRATSEQPIRAKTENASRGRRGRLHRLFGKLQTAWSILGIALFLFLMLEVGLHAFEAIQRRMQVSMAVQHWSQALTSEGPESLAILEQEARDRVYDLFPPVRWEPYVYWRSQSDGSRVSPAGLRHTWNSADASEAGVPADDVVRIFMFGGSALWGFGARDEHTIPSELSRFLADRGFKVHVTNFGENGYVSTQEVITLMRRLQRRDVPELVIFYDGFNDIGSTMQNRGAGLTANASNRESEFNLLRGTSVARSLQPLIRCLATYRLLSGALTLTGWNEPPLPPTTEERLRQALNDAGIEPTMTPDGPKYPDEVVHEIFREVLIDDLLYVYAANFDLVDAMGERFGFDTLYYWQPCVFDKDRPSQFERMSLAENPQIAEAATQCSSRIEQIGRENGITDEVTSELLSRVQFLGDVFNTADWENRTAFFDVVHTTEEANRVLAEEMVDDVIARIRAKPKSNGATTGG